MKTYNTYFTGELKLKQFLTQNNIIDNPRILIQAFTGIADLEFIKGLLTTLKTLLPSAKIIGASTDGEISNGIISTEKTILSFSIFDDIEVKTAFIQEKDSVQCGKSLAEKLFKEDSKVLITFTDGLNTNAEEFLAGVVQVNPNIVIAGGKAGDNAAFISTYVFSNEGISTNGAVGAVLNGRNLHIHTDYSFDWKSLGKELTVTKAKGNRVYQLDNKTAYDSYSYFLGENMAQQIPDVGIEFPLIVKRDGISIARMITGKEKDGSLTFGGNIHEGEKVKIGFGKVEMILSNSHQTLRNINNRPVESIFIYSCMARRRFMPNSIGSETEPLQNIAPTAGFFTYGEFYSAKNKELLNQTMTILALSESSEVIQVTESQLTAPKYSEGAVEVLSRLIDATTDELQNVNNRLNTAIEGSNEGLWEWSSESNALYFSPIWKEIIGYTNKELQNTFCMWSELIHPKDRKAFFSTLKSCLKGDIKKMNFVHRLKHKDGHWVWVRCKGSVFLNENNKISGISGFYSDLTKEKKAQEKIVKQSNKLQYQNNHDALTGLKNRTYFYNFVDQRIAMLKNSDTKLAIIFIDLDGFKKINDTMGHDVGDKVLIQVANTLEQNMKEGDLIARLAGDEFVILLNEIQQDRNIQECLDLIIEIMQINTIIDKQRVDISASVGVALYPDNGNDADTLIINADIAMYKSKELGKNTYHFYKKTMSEELLHKISLEADLKKAIENKEFIVYYQPQFDAKTSSQVGMEALIRWNSPKRGFVPPNEFIPIAEEMGLIIQIDEITMATAIKQIASWHKQGLNPGFVSLNVSISQLESKSFVPFLSQTLEQTQCPPSCVEIEITERQIMKDTDNVIRTLEKIKDLGVLLSIDDFGTGQSSLAYLAKLPISKIKIDQSFVQKVPQNKEDVVIVNAIISIAKSLNFLTVAEGVESQEQKYFIKKSGCNIIQGHYYSPAMNTKSMSLILGKLSKQKNRTKTIN